MMILSMVSISTTVATSYYQLTAKTPILKNLITGTRYLNIDGMLPFENMVADYARRKPATMLCTVLNAYFEGDNLQPTAF